MNLAIKDNITIEELKFCKRGEIYSLPTIRYLFPFNVC